MRRKIWLSCVLAICFPLFACGAPGLVNRVQFSSLPNGGPAVTLFASLYKPAGPGPFPAVVVLHHCGGIDSDLQAWAGHLAELGYVAIVPDSFGSRGIGRVCATGQLSPAARVPDAYAAATYLRSLPEVKGDRIGLIGFSHGAGTIATLASRPPLAAPFRAAVAYYPNCPASGTSADPPLLILIGAKDDWTPAAPCVDWGARVGDRGRLDVVVYPNAWHKFDGHGSAEVLGGFGVMHHLERDGAAAADANARAEAFLARWLKS